MPNYLAEFANFGRQPTLGERSAALREKQAAADLKTEVVQEMRGERANKNVLRGLYEQYVGGDQAAIQKLAGLDPDMHMKIQDRQQEQQGLQAQKLARQVIWANDPQKWQATHFGQQGVPFEQREQVIARFIGEGDTFKTFQDREQTQMDFDLRRRGQDITVRGQDITKRGQDITRRGQDINARDTQGTGDMRKYQELVSLGVPDNIARGISYGAYRNVTDPASGATLIIDLTTNQPVGRMVPSDPSRPHTSGYRWEPDMKNGMIQRPAGGSASNMNTGTIERGMVPPGNPYADPNDPLGLFK